MSTKKFLRFFLILAAVVIAAIFIVGLTQQRSITVSRSITINAPKEKVFEQMVLFKNWPNWSPWSRMDTSMKNEFKGTDGQTGSSYHWVGDEKITGEAEITNMAVNGTEMQFSFKLIKPEAPEATGMVSAKDSSGATVATISFTNRFDYPWNAMIIFTDLDKTYRNDLENALKNMKAIAEKK